MVSYERSYKCFLKRRDIGVVVLMWLRSSAVTSKRVRFTRTGTHRLPLLPVKVGNQPITNLKSVENEAGATQPWPGPVADFFLSINIDGKSY